ncbi:182 kDa tankyrase-1-binding protein isoform X2 [Melopsittacus undulatus]|nr:182 kDa tankyrase-1-binding protein isoform X2 [Melopsittacus undulatus]
MASQPLHPALPCTAPAGTGGLAGGSPDTGTARPKPPLRPKPHVLPKPAVPAKTPLPPPAPRHPRPELPSAEKMNRLAGPQPYGTGSMGGPLRRPSFTIKSPHQEPLIEKGLPSPAAAAGEATGVTPGEESPLPPTPSRKGPAPFKVTPVPVAIKPERFPGTTVEQILAKMDTREGPGSPDRARLCPDLSLRFGSKPFTAFRRRPSGEVEGAAPGDAPQPAAGEPGPGDDGHPTAETSGSPPAGPSSAGAPRGHRRPSSPPDLSSLQLGPPGSPRPPSCPAPAPGAPSQPYPAAPGSPHAPPELLAPGSPTRAPGSPESRPPASASVASSQAPGAPSSTAEPQLSISRSPGSPHTPGEGSPDNATPPGTPELPPRTTCPPGSPEAAVQCPASPSPPPEPLGNVSRPPGSPEGPDDPAAPPLSSEGPNFSPAPPCRRSSEGVLRPPPAGQGLGGLGGSLGALPQPGDPVVEPALGSESGWSLSQSFEWTFPARGGRRVPSPPRSPIRETGDSDGEDPAPGAAEPGPRGAEGAPCPGGPVAHAEVESSPEEDDDGEAEQDVTLCVTEPGQDPAEPEPHSEAAPLHPAPPAPATGTGSVWAPEGDSALSLQGPGGPGPAGGSPRSRDVPSDPGWLMELLASPGAHTGQGTEGLLGWSRKDLSSEFGISTPSPGSAFRWTQETDWPREPERDRELRTEQSWGSTGAGDQPFGTTRSDWGSGCRGTELPGDAGLGHSDWHKAPGAGESCRQEQDFGASKPTWGTGYGLDSTGSRDRIGSGNTDWSSSYSAGGAQRQDEELSSRQPSWASKYSSGDRESQDQATTPAWAGQYGCRDPEMKDRELSPDWTSKYSSRDAETTDKDLTLGWAGRSSTGDTGTAGREFSPSRVAWDSQYSTRDMESQDREFSPSRSAWTGECSTQGTESQDREFSFSRPAEADGYSTRDMESQDLEFSPSRPAWEDRYSTRHMESQDQEFSPSRPAWTSECSTRDMEDQAWKFCPGRPAWDSKYSSRDMENQEGEFSSSRSAKSSEGSTRDMESQDGEFKPSRPAWEDRFSTRDVESLDQFSPSRLTEPDGYSTRDMEPQDREFSPARPAKASEHSIGVMETWERELSPSRSAWDDQRSTRDVETWGEELSPGRATEASECSTRDMESQDREFSLAWEDRFSTRHLESQDSGFKPNKPAWDEEHSTRDMESQEQELSSSRAAEADGHRSRDMESQVLELSPGSLTWASECSSADTREEGIEVRSGRSPSQTEPVDAAADGKEFPSSPCPDPTSQDPGCGSTEHSAAGTRDWAEEPGDAECHSQFSSTGTEQELGPSSAAVSTGGFMPWVGAMGAPEDQHRDVPCGTSGGAGLQEHGCGDAEAQRREWADAFSARCAARSRDTGERHRGGDTSSVHSSVGLWDPILQMGEPPAVGSPCTDPPSPTEEERDPLELGPAPRSPGASSPLPEAVGGTPLDTGSAAAPSDHLDGKRPPSWEEKWLPVGTPHPEAPPDLAGQEFTFLEDAEVLDSRVLRSKAELGRQRRHRAPVLRPSTGPDGDTWLFRDCSEPRTPEDEAAAEPRSRRPGRAGRGPLFPSLSAAALKAKLRGRNRSAEEGTPPGDSKVTPPREPHVQRSKSCKIPGLSGKPLVLPPKPERSSGSEASPPHWLQALKLKKKKP